MEYNMLSIKNLEKIYEPRNGIRVRALKGITLDFPEKGFVFIQGKSGSGKSTLMHLLGGLDRPTGGEIIVAGRSSKNFSKKDFDGYRNNHVGFVFQEYNLINHYTAGANVALALELQGKKVTRSEVDAVLREMELVDDDGNTLYDRRVNELSGGQKQRIAIARALIKDPQILLADEPTGALDSQTGTELYELFKRLSSNKLIIIISHDVESAKKYGDRIIELKDGDVLSDTGCLENEKEPSVTAAAFSAFPGKLPIKRTLTMGLAGLRCKPFRLIMSVILAVMSFTFSCFAIVSATTDVMAAELKTAYNNGAKTAVVTADSIGKSYTKHADGHTSKGTFECTPVLTNEQIGMLEQMDDFVLMKIVNPWDLPNGIGKNNLGVMSQAEFYNPYNYLSRGGFQRMVELDSKSGEVDAFLKPDPRLTVECRLPQNFSEIAITDYWADMYMRFGFVDGNGVTHAIAGPDDLIGRIIAGKFTICGVYSTYEDKEWLKQYDYNEQQYEYITNDYISRWLNGEHIMSYAFVCDGFSEEFAPELSDEMGKATFGVLYQLSGSVAKDKKLIDKISYSYRVELLPEENLGAYMQTDYFISAKLLTGYTGYAEAMAFFRDETFITIASIVSICFAVFSVLLLTSFLSSNMQERKRELGILRALGARSTDVVKICITESFVIACVDFVLSLILTGIICLALNIAYSFWLFGIGIIPLLVLILICFGVAALATVIPAIRLAKKKPIDVINDK